VRYATNATNATLLYMGTTLFFCSTCAAEYHQQPGYCFKCGRFDTIFPNVYRPVESLWHGETIKTAEDLYKKPRLFKLKPYPIPIGRPALTVVYGSPGHGKSTMVTKIADARGGSVLMVPLEEGFGEALSSRLRRLEVSRADLLIALLHDVSTIDKAIEEHGIEMFVLDSITVSTLRPRDLVALARQREVEVVCVAQVNKAGDLAGALELAHDCDVLIRVEEMKWKVEKNRFGELLSGEVLS